MFGFLVESVSDERNVIYFLSGLNGYRKWVNATCNCFILTKALNLCGLVCLSYGVKLVLEKTRLKITFYKVS